MADRFGHGFAWAPDYGFYWGRKFPLWGMGSSRSPMMDKKVKVVKPRELQVLRQIIPSNVMTIGVPGNPFMALGDSRRSSPRLGALTEEEIVVQNDALKDYSDNLGLARSLISQLEQIRPSDWEETILSAQDTQQAGLDFYTNLVHEKTGNPEAERMLRQVWISVGQKMMDLVDQKPSMLEMMGDQILVFLGDWAAGCREVWDGYVDWAMENAGPTLKNYHAASVRLLELENDLVEAEMAKTFTAQKISDQTARIADARAAINRASAVYASIGGGSLDELAQKNYGEYPSALMQIQIPVAAAVAIAICAAVVAIAVSVTLSIGFLKVGAPLAEGIKNTAESVAKAIGDNIVPISIIAGLTVLGVFVLPAVLPDPKKKRAAAATA